MREEQLPDFMGHTPLVIYTLPHAIWAPRGIMGPSPAIWNMVRKKTASLLKEEQEWSKGASVVAQG